MEMTLSSAFTLGPKRKLRYRLFEKTGAQSHMKCHSESGGREHRPVPGSLGFKRLSQFLVM